MFRRLDVVTVVLVLEAPVVAFQDKVTPDNKDKGLRASKMAAALRVKARLEAKVMAVDHLAKATIMMTRAISSPEASLAAVARPIPVKVQGTLMALLEASLAIKATAPRLKEQTTMDPGLSNLEKIKTLPETAGKAVTEANQALVMAMVLQAMLLERSLAQVLRAEGRLAPATILEAPEVALVATAKTAREDLARTAAAQMEPTPMVTTAQARATQAETEMLMGVTPLAAVVAMMVVPCLTEVPEMAANLARTALALKELGRGPVTVSQPTMEDRGVPLLEGAVQEAALAETEASTAEKRALPALTVLPVMNLLDLVREVTIHLLVRVGESKAPVLRMMTREEIHPQATVHQTTGPEAPTTPTAARVEHQAETRMAARVEALMMVQMVVPMEARAEVQAAPTETLEVDQTLVALGLGMETPAATVQGMNQTTGENQLFPAPTIPNAYLKVAWMATAALFECKVSMDVRVSRAAQTKSVMMETAFS